MNKGLNATRTSGRGDVETVTQTLELKLIEAVDQTKAVHLGFARRHLWDYALFQNVVMEQIFPEYCVT